MISTIYINYSNRIKVWPTTCNYRWQVQKRGVCVTFRTEFWGQKDKRDKKHSNPGIDCSYSAGR
jgi:hypothetical protein